MFNITRDATYKKPMEGVSSSRYMTLQKVMWQEKLVHIVI